MSAHPKLRQALRRAPTAACASAGRGDLKQVCATGIRPGGKTALTLALAALATLSPGLNPSALAAVDPPGSTIAPASSAMDAPLFYQLLIGEMELRNGQPGNAYQIVLDAARRTRDEALFRRAIEIALQARAGEEALRATRAWRQSVPTSTEAVMRQLQVLVALQRTPEWDEPLKTLLQISAAAERPGILAAVPRLVQRAPNPALTLATLQPVLRPYLSETATRVAASIAMGRLHLQASEHAAALGLARQAAQHDPSAVGPALLALDLLESLESREGAQSLIENYIARPDSVVGVQLAYARVLAGMQRLGPAVSLVRKATEREPDNAQAWLTLGALELDVHQPAQAEFALKRYLALRPSEATATPSADSGATQSEAAPAPTSTGLSDAQRERNQALMLLARSSELQGQWDEAERSLEQVQGQRNEVELVIRRATVSARRGRLEEARQRLGALPRASQEEQRTAALAEAQVWRSIKQWRSAYEALERVRAAHPEDADLMYDFALAAERVGRWSEMESALRRVMTMRPQSPNAFNALGYAWAERGVQLAEARELVETALRLAPGDPYITDSLGWVAFRQGQFEEAERLLRQAHSAKPDVEIAAHLGEVLWTMGRRDEARQVLGDALKRDAHNEVLAETLKRLGIKP